MRMRLIAATAVFVLSTIAVGCSEQPVDCQDDAECADDEICSDGVCRVVHNDGLNINERNGDPNDNDFNVNDNDADCPDDGCHPRASIPRLVDFRRATAGNEYRKTTYVKNDGEEPLAIDDITLETDAAFELTFPGVHPATDDPPPPQQDEETFSEATLEPGEDLLIRVWYRPEHEEPAEGHILVDTNSVDQQQHVVEVRVNTPTACLRPLPASPNYSVDFGPVTIDESATRTVTIENCSLADELEIFSMSISTDDDGAFSIAPDSYPGNLPQETYVLDPKETTSITVEYSPGDEQAHTGELVLTSTDAFNPERRIPLSGEGTTSTCPVAVGEVVGHSGDEVVEVQPQEDVQLSAADSYDPDGGDVADNEWVLTAKPFASHPFLAFEPTRFSSEPTLWLDVAGVYQLELIVYDEQGLASCQPDTLEIHAIPDHDIYVEAAWHNTITNDTEIGEGTDVELHYAHPNGEWGSPNWSVSAHSPEHEWGGGEIEMRNTDVWGEFPEVVTHQQPVDGHSYQVGLFYAWDFNAGASDATISIYSQGELLWMIQDERLFEQGELLYVGDVDWDGGAQFDEVLEFVDDHSLEPEPPS